MIRPKRKLWSSWSIPYLGVAAVLAALIPIAIEPILNSEKYSEYQMYLWAFLLIRDVNGDTIRILIKCYTLHSVAFI